MSILLEQLVATWYKQLKTETCSFYPFAQTDVLPTLTVFALTGNVRKSSSPAHHRPNTLCDKCNGYYTQGALFRSPKVPFSPSRVPPTGLWDAVKNRKNIPWGSGFHNVGVMRAINQSPCSGGAVLFFKIWLLRIRDARGWSQCFTTFHLTKFSLMAIFDDRRKSCNVNINYNITKF